jgi:hypothetical protein
MGWSNTPLSGDILWDTAFLSGMLFGNHFLHVEIRSWSEVKSSWTVLHVETATYSANLWIALPKSSIAEAVILSCFKVSLAWWGILVMISLDRFQSFHSFLSKLQFHNPWIVYTCIKFDLKWTNTRTDTANLSCHVISSILTKVKWLSVSSGCWVPLDWRFEVEYKK